MADDKDGQSPDPWASIDSGGDQADAEGFSFSFDAVEEPAGEEGVGEGFAFTSDDVGDLPAVPDLEAADIPPAVTADAEAGDELASAWLEAAEPLAEATAETSFDAPVDQGIDPTGAAPSPEQGDDLFSFATPDDQHAFDATQAAASLDASLDASFAGGSSSVEIGTGESGIVSESDIVPAEDAVAERSGMFAGEMFADEQPGDPFEAVGSGVLESEEADAGASDDLGFGEAASGAAVVAAAAASTKSLRTVTAKRAKGGGIGQMVGVVLGGLMALPITYAILIWGFGKDPFKFTKSVPPEFAFLLPAKLQPGVRGAGMPRIDKAPSLDDIVQTAPPTAEPEAEMPAAEPKAEMPAAEPTAAAPAKDAEPAMADSAPAGSPADPADSAVVPEPAAPPAAPPPPAPPPLDLSGVDEALAEAADAMESVSNTDDTDPARKKLIVGWYKKLAKVGEELTSLEAVAADTGRPLADAPEQVSDLYSRIAASDTMVEDLKRLCRDWVAFPKRPADGVVLVAIVDDVRRVGPYWCSTVSLEQADGSSKPVSVISRIEPKAAAGDRAIVSGVVFDDDVVWAADLRPLAAEAGVDLF
jgi:hypothetical protein